MSSKHYAIQNRYSGLYARRNVVEDLSLNPKPILGLPQAGTSEDSWRMDHKSDGSTFLFTRGSLIGVYYEPDGYGIYAQLIDGTGIGEDSFRWFLDWVEANRTTVIHLEADRNLVWTGGEAYAKVVLEPYRPRDESQVWVIQDYSDLD